MQALPRAIAKRRSRVALRLLAAAGLVAMLGGCYQPREVQIEYQSDYRLRHPIALKEGERSVEIFLGRNRGGLTDRKSTRLNSSHIQKSRMPSSA